jgi:hypothetical protein
MKGIFLIMIVKFSKRKLPIGGYFSLIRPSIFPVLHVSFVYFPFKSVYQLPCLEISFTLFLSLKPAQLIARTSECYKIPPLQRHKQCCMYNNRNS